VRQHLAEGSYMRRVVTLFVIVMAALALTACGAAPADTTTTTGTPPAGVPAVTPAAAAAAAPTGDTNSPTQTVVPGEMFPTDPSSVPSAVLTLLAAKRPLMVVWSDPTTKVSKDQRAEADATLSKYRGMIDLVALDYTVGLNTGGAKLDAETQKMELLAAALKVNTTPYIVFVDRYGRITYRFAGYTDRMLLRREVVRATQ
jgi:hypothetical protein